MKNLTDYFQSLGLLESGVPRESSDYFFASFQKSTPFTKGECEPTFPYIPCWSIGALWQYLYEHNCDITFTFDTEQSSEELIEGLVNAAIMVKERE